MPAGSTPSRNVETFAATVAICIHVVPSGARSISNADSSDDASVQSRRINHPSVSSCAWQRKALGAAGGGRVGVNVAVVVAVAVSVAVAGGLGVSVGVGLAVSVDVNEGAGVTVVVGEAVADSLGVGELTHVPSMHAAPGRN